MMYELPLRHYEITFCYCYVIPPGMGYFIPEERYVQVNCSTYKILTSFKFHQISLKFVDQDPIVTILEMV